MARSTVADVVVDGLRRAGASRVFTSRSMRGLVGLEEAFARHGFSLMRAATPAAACVMAAALGQLDDAPGVVAVDANDVEAARPGVRYAADNRAAVIVLTPVPDAAAATLVKGAVVVDAASAAHWTAHAAQLAFKDPRGPVQLVVPDSIQGEATLPVATAMRPVPSAPEAGALDDAAAMLGGASHPILITGLECRYGGVASWLRPFAEALPAPVLTTLGGKGALPDPHPLALGLMGSPTARTLVDRADLVVTIGVDARELPSHGWPETTPTLRMARVAGVDARHGSLELIGDIALAIEELAPRLRSRARADWDVAELDRLERSGEASARAAGDAMADVVGIARELTPAGTIMTVGPVTNMPAVAAAWPAVAPGEFMSCDRDDFALAAAIAIASRDTRRRVVCVTRGDVAGLAELDTLARLGAPVVVVTFGAASSAPPPPIVMTTPVDAGDWRAAIATALLRSTPTLIVTGPV